MRGIGREGEVFDKNTLHAHMKLSINKRTIITTTTTGKTGIREIIESLTTEFPLSK